MNKKNIRVFLVSIDYYEYFEVISIIFFFSFFFNFFLFSGSTYFRYCIIFSKQAQNTKNWLKLFLKVFKIGIGSLPICE
jgi:hypothetical protein